MNYIVKQPIETYPVGIDYTGKLPTGYVVASGTVSAINKSTLVDETGVILVSTICLVDPVQETALCVLTGGALGTDYTVTIVLTTTPTGVVLSDTFTVAVRNC